MLKKKLRIGMEVWKLFYGVSGFSEYYIYVILAT